MFLRHLSLQLPEHNVAKNKKIIKKMDVCLEEFVRVRIRLDTQ